MSDETAELGPELRLEAGGVSARLSFPLRVKVNGIDAVLVSAAAYDALSNSVQKSVGNKSKIERDTEVKALVDDRLTTHELASIRDEIIRQFGMSRAPSISALGRYSIARRRAVSDVVRPGRGRSGPRRPG